MWPGRTLPMRSFLLRRAISMTERASSHRSGPTASSRRCSQSFRVYVRLKQWWGPLADLLETTHVEEAEDINPEQGAG